MCVCLSFPLFINKKTEEVVDEITQAKVKYRIVDIDVRDIDLSVKTTKSLVSRLAQVNKQEYKAKLTAHASSNKVIILALADYSFFDMTLNFYETSLLKFNIKNYLFIATEMRTCEVLWGNKINCYVYLNMTTSGKTSVFNSFDFLQKMNLRTLFVFDALRFGFTILQTDVDVIFLQNPLPDIYSSVRSDVACLWDNGECNSGFVYIKPTNFTLAVYRKMSDTVRRGKMIADQKELTKVIATLMRIYKGFVHLKQFFDPKRYKCGLTFFEVEGRYFSEHRQCRQCIVVHNNWIVGKEAKRYRFRELLLWSYDDNGYYTNTSTKYLTYSNAPVTGTQKMDRFDTELDALKTALYIGQLLQRVVILPRFHLSERYGKTVVDIERPLNQWIKMSNFDGQFYKKYRENVFLRHKKVPETIKEKISRPFWIQTEQSEAVLGKIPDGVIVLNATGSKKATSKDILDWFVSERSAILNFHSLYGVFGRDAIPDCAATAAFKHKLELAFKLSNYRQLA